MKAGLIEMIDICTASASIAFAGENSYFVERFCCMYDTQRLEP